LPENALDSGISTIILHAKDPGLEALETSDDDLRLETTMAPDLHDLASFRGSALYKLTDIHKLCVGSNRLSNTGTDVVPYPMFSCTHLSAFLVPSIYTIREVDMNLQDRIGEDTHPLTRCLSCCETTILLTPTPTASASIYLPGATKKPL
jgi:hypothetical protein